MSGDEQIRGTGTTAVDFWAWSLSDTRANTVRSMLAEYLIAEAMGVRSRPRVEWDPCDVVVPAGRIEVKASAYLQAWAQRTPSRIVFSGLKGRTWSPEAGYSDAQTYNADVYVFAVLSARVHDEYDAFDTDRWQFWVLPLAAIEQHAAASSSLATVRRLAGAPVAYPDLAAEVRAALAAPRRL